MKGFRDEKETLENRNSGRAVDVRDMSDDSVDAFTGKVIAQQLDLERFRRRPKDRSKGREPGRL